MDRPPRRRPDGRVTRREFLGLAGLAGLGTLLDAAGLSPGRIRRVLRRARSALGRPLHLRNAVGDLLSRSTPYDPSKIGIEITAHHLRRRPAGGARRLTIANWRPARRPRPGWGRRDAVVAR